MLNFSLRNKSTLKTKIEINFNKVNSAVTFGALFLSVNLVLTGCADPTNRRLDSMNEQMGNLNKRLDDNQKNIDSVSKSAEKMSDNTDKALAKADKFEDDAQRAVNEMHEISKSMKSLESLAETLSKILQDRFKETEPAPSADLPKASSPTPISKPDDKKEQNASEKNPKFESNAVAGEPVKLSEDLCIEASAEKVMATLIDYDHYSQVPGSAYSIPGLGAALRMVKSQGSFDEKSNVCTNARVWLVFQPLNFSDSSTLYPRLMLNCSSESAKDGSSVHHCKMIRDVEHFGLYDFESTILVKNGGCKNNKTLVSYQIQMTGASNEIDAIKAKAVAPLGRILGALASEFFQEKMFFKAYFKNLYTTWIKSVK